MKEQQIDHRKPRYSPFRAFSRSHWEIQFEDVEQPTPPLIQHFALREK